jgi:hypothetical protein
MADPEVEPSSIAETYIEEYIRIAASTNWDYGMLPQLSLSSHVAPEAFGEAIRRLIKEYSIVPRVPSEYFIEDPLSLYNIIGDDEAYELLVRSSFSSGFDALCANLLASEVAIPPGLGAILASRAPSFRCLGSGNLPLPLDNRTLADNLALLVNVLTHVSPQLHGRAAALLVRVLCHSQEDDMRLSEISRSLMDPRTHSPYLSFLPLLHMLNDPKKFSVMEFIIVLRVLLDCGVCKQEKLDKICLYYLFPYARR